MAKEKMTFAAIGEDIFVKRGDESPVKTLKVVGGSFSRHGLAEEIADVLNKHYSE